MKRPGLGRGLDVLLPQTDEILQTVVRDISIDEIDPNTDQPRKEFDKEALEQLSQSIQEAGVLSPILVVENNGRYRIVAGEPEHHSLHRAQSDQCAADGSCLDRKPSAGRSESH